MTDKLEMSGDDFIGELPEELKDAPITPQMGIAAIALNYALKYADINTVQEGALYQQYKLEGRNMRGLHLDEVFHYAKQIERHLLETPSRLALIVWDAVAEDIETVIADGDASGIETEGEDHEDGLRAEHESPTVEDGDAQGEPA